MNPPESFSSSYLAELIAARLSELLQKPGVQIPDEASRHEIIHSVASAVAAALCEEEEKAAIVKICRRLHHMGYFAGTSGNVSVRLPGGDILVTPSGVNKSSLASSDIVRLSPGGAVCEGTGKPSSETRMHLFSYERRPDVHAIVHAHPPFATGFAAARVALDRPVLPEAILILGSIPLVEYGTPSTWELPESLAPYVANHNAFLLANHGALTFGDDVHQASHRMETLELFANVILVARLLGGEKLLSAGELERLARIR
ncbi:MAG: class II aldolase/adducin family protein [Candidatus Eremiobacteraeota bacterium]|nr:class II aldolase/adducin family protein [Candidatus Eremiobacteraeota bacterium]